jgi:alkaline phosphatase D
MRPVLRTLLLAALFLLSVCHTSAQTTHPLYGSGKPAPDMIVSSGGAPNDSHAKKQHYVVLVSLDGFRYDYPEEYGANNLLALAKDGARAPQGMLPSYPSLTFPNHYTLVTGLLPERHGIVRNSFYDPARKQVYEYKNAATSSDGTWYGGVPLWALAEQQGMRSAVFMWPGSEAEIAGKRPNYYAHFTDNLDGHAGLDQIEAWLKLPETDRPHLILFYMPTTDHAGHWYGPDSAEEATAVHQMDSLMGELRQRLNATGLPVDLVIVSDHGMVAIDKNWINFDEIAPTMKGIKFHDWSVYADSEAQTAAIYDQLKEANDPRFSVYRRKDVPAYLHYSDNARIGDPVLIPNGAYIGHLHASTVTVNPGDHGYDPTKLSAMKATFIANGPDIRKGVSLPVFANVDVYSFVSKLLNLKPAANDGELGPLKQALKK